MRATTGRPYESHMKGSYIKSFTRFFSKNRRFLGRRPKSRSAEREIPPPSKRSGGGLGEPYQGVPPYFFDRLGRSVITPPFLSNITYCQRFSHVSPFRYCTPCGIVSQIRTYGIPERIFARCSACVCVSHPPNTAAPLPDSTGLMP